MAHGNGTDLLVLRVTQVAMIFRLVSMVPVAISVIMHPTADLWITTGYVCVALIGLAVLTSAKARSLMAQHPLLIMIDLLLLAAVAIGAGTDSAFVLTFMTSALVVGLWSQVWVGVIQIAALVTLQFGLAVYQGDTGTARLLIIPFTQVVLWALGMVVRRSTNSAREAQTALRTAIGSAAATQERTRLAREMHDRVAKSLQGINLMAAALPTLADRDPARAKAQAQAIQDQSIAAMSEVRELISEFRLPDSDQAIDVLVGQVLDDWAAETGIPVRRQLAAGVALPESVRYELLMVLAEGLENIKRHAAATRATVRLETAGDHVELSLEDNGRGAPAHRLGEAETDGHFGVCGMRERIVGVGGQFDWQSQPEHGTRLTARVHRQGLVEVGAGEGTG